MKQYKCELRYYSLWRKGNLIQSDILLNVKCDQMPFELSQEVMLDKYTGLKFIMPRYECVNFMLVLPIFQVLFHFYQSFVLLKVWLNDLITQEFCCYSAQWILSHFRQKKFLSHFILSQVFLFQKCVLCRGRAKTIKCPFDQRFRKGIGQSEARGTTFR